MAKAVLCRVICIVLLISWAITIFTFSSQNSTTSSDTSSGVVEKVINVIYPDFDEFAVDEQTEIIGTFTFIIRKTAHFLEYFILGVLSVVTLFVFKCFKLLNCGIISVSFCLIFAVSDEIHQHFIPGRACRFFDVCVDGMGAALAIFLLVFFKYKKRRKSGESYAKKEVG